MKNLLLLLLMALACACASAQCGSPAYVEPDFTIAVQNPACPLVGEIKVTSVADGVGPFTYTLLPNNISNTTGTFSNLTPGSYIVQLKDACGSIRSRQATITPYTISSTSSYTSLGCGNFSFTVNASVSGPSLQYGFSLNGGATIIWGDSAVMRLKISLPANISLFVRDACGNQAFSSQYIPEDAGGYIKELQERIKCNGQEIYPVYFGFSSPNVCLYKYPQNTLVECKQAPAGTYNGGALTNFFDLPFGQDYYVIVQDGCYRDSAFFKDKTSVGGSELNPFNWKCNTFDLHSDGGLNDSVCLYNAVTNQLISCLHINDTAINPNTGKPWPYSGAEWYDLPYGSYYTYIFDPCLDTLIRIDTTVRYPFRSFSNTYGSCVIGQSAVAVNYGAEAPQPWTTYVYWPNDSLVGTFQSSGANWNHHYPTAPFPGLTKVITEDGCGKRDTSFVMQRPLLPIRRLEVKGGCPGILGQSGGGDIILHGSAAAYAGAGNGGPLASVRIIKKDGVDVDIPQTHTQFSAANNEQDYFFTNLSTGVYIIESTIGCQAFKAYDTIEINPYVYPLQEQTHITQCGINPYVFRDTVSGGVAPFTYEILATNPALPSLLTGPQASNIFAVPPGTNLNTITLQVIDACGNSNTKIFPVDHLSTCTPLEVDSLDNHLVLQNKPIRIFPNPSGKQFTIAFAQKKKTDYRLEIYNTAGLKIHSRLLSGIDKRNVIINEHLTPGVYIINIIDVTNNKQFFHKQLIL